MSISVLCRKHGLRIVLEDNVDKCPVCELEKRIDGLVKETEVIGEDFSACFNDITKRIEALESMAYLKSCEPKEPEKAEESELENYLMEYKKHGCYVPALAERIRKLAIRKVGECGSVGCVGSGMIIYEEARKKLGEM